MPATATSDLIMSTVNVAECISKLVDKGDQPAEAIARMLGLALIEIDFSSTLSHLSGALRATTRSAGLSLGDRACLALAIERSLPAVTADRPWAKLDIGVDVRLIR